MQIFRSLRTVRAGQVILIFLLSLIVWLKSANIGGTLALALETPIKPLVDVTTTSVVQSPVEFNYESRGMSWFHTGADLVAKTGIPVKPFLAGVVKEVNFGSFGYGNHVIISHAGGLESLYAHLSKINVEKGQKVVLETKIGEVGSTGFSTGPHLHLEIHQNGQLLNPADIVPGVK